MIGYRYVCREERRLTAVKRAGVRNGIEYVEVAEGQRTLLLRLLLPAAGLSAANVRIDGGERIPTVAVQWAAAADALPPGEVVDVDQPDHVLVVRTVERGDFSRYTLRLVAGPGTDQPPAGFDPLLAQVTFSFKVECGTDFDCRDVLVCTPPAAPAPAIDYLAKDYSSLRRLILDRMTLLAPDWRERSPADLGVALVELVAYVGDRLSYQQDAVATEAFLGTARRRVALRRHARLVDYLVHEGCSARVFVRVGVTTAGVTLPAGTPLLTRTPGLEDRLEPGGPKHRAALDSGAVVFETVEDTVLYPDHDVLHFYTWGDLDCCLPRGATRATLRGSYPRLKAGDVLVLAEIVSPTTGLAGDAETGHRWPVRLTHVLGAEDPSGGLFDDPATGDPVPVTEICWDAADALPFPLCLTATLPDTDGPLDVGVAWGNVVVADHGQTVDGEELGSVAPPRFRPALAKRPVSHVVDVRAVGLFSAEAVTALLDELDDLVYGPQLRDLLVAHGIVLHAEPVTVGGGDGVWSVADGETVLRFTLDGPDIVVTGRPAAASAVTAGLPRTARPAAVLSGVHNTVTTEWLPQADLLASGGDTPEFVLEVEHDGTATARFGDGVHGRRPAAGTVYTARYRVGNGAAGNIGAESIAHVATVDGQILWVRNPIPAAGGVDPESAAQVRRDAPEAFSVQERAVTEADYAEMAQRHPQVQRAAATFRWTGSWHTVFVTVDRLGGGPITPVFEDELRAHLERYRMAGYDLEVDGPAFVPLDVGVHVCVAPDHFRAQVGREVLRTLVALFHPDNLTFGQPVHLSPIYAAAQAVPGVSSVSVHTFTRRGVDDGGTALADGVLPMDRLEIARLDNDPNFPERGALVLTVGGGK